MSNEVEFNSLTKDDVKIRFEEPSRVPSKPTDEEVLKHRKTRIILVVIFAAVVIAMIVAAIIIIVVAPRCAEKAEEGGEKEPQKEYDDSWWQNAAFYQVYPRSFKDSDGDGVGDLKGIIEKLDYFSELGVTVIWLNPIYKSPMVDNGYDVENYTAIDSVFGSMEDFDKLLAEAHKKGIKIIMDFVPNHTSDKHPWFVESSSSKDNPKRDWYIWRDPVNSGNTTSPPNNWASVFNGSAWSLDATTQQYYLHQFYKEQPDLNLRNAEVKEALKAVMRFWLDKGVDGFRVDAVQFLLEDDQFRDEPTTSSYNASLELTYDMLDHSLTNDLAVDRDIVKEFLEVTASYNTTNNSRILIAEVHKSVPEYYAVTDFPFNFGLIFNVKKPGMSLSQNINATVSEFLASVPEGKSPNWVIGNHDKSRVGNRLGESNRIGMNVLQLTLPGLATTYYGEEIGMLDGNVPNATDPRDKERTPMQWNKEAKAGFTTGDPWLPVASDYLTVNVDTEKADNASIYNMYKKIVKLRSESAFLSKEFKVVQVDRHIFAYTRGANEYLVSINFSDELWNEDIAGLSGKGTIVFDSEDKQVGVEDQDVNKFQLNPGQVLIIKLNA